MEMKTFNIGDLVTCNRNNYYAITRPGVICSVVDSYVNGNKECMTVKIVEGDDIHKGKMYHVIPELFDFVYSSCQSIDEKEIFSLMRS